MGPTDGPGERRLLASSKQMTADCSTSGSVPSLMGAVDDKNGLDISELPKLYSQLFEDRVHEILVPREKSIDVFRVIMILFRLKVVRLHHPTSLPGHLKFAHNIVEKLD